MLTLDDELLCPYPTADVEAVSCRVSTCVDYAGPSLQPIFVCLNTTPTFDGATVGQLLSATYRRVPEISTFLHLCLPTAFPPVSHSLSVDSFDSWFFVIRIQSVPPQPERV